MDILRLAAGNDDVPSQGGGEPTVVVTVPLEVLEKELGTAMLDGGTFLSAAHARMLACDCRIVSMVLGSNSEPLDIGRAERNIPLGIRRALVHPTADAPSRTVTVRRSGAILITFTIGQPADLPRYATLRSSADSTTGCFISASGK